MDKTRNKISYLFLRYFLILLAGIGGGWIFYQIFLYPTTFFSAKILSFFGKTYSLKDFILFNENPIEISKACVAAAAYYLFFILVMAIPLNFKKRIKLLVFNFGVFFLVNVLRIVLMAFFIDKSFFDSVHMLIWNIFSTIFVFLIWFSSTNIFKIKEIPFYDDFKYLKYLLN